MTGKTEQTQPEDKAPDGPKRKKRFFGLRVLQLSSSLVVLFVVGIALAVAVSIDRPVPAPEWLRQQVQAQLSDAVPDGTVEVAAINMVIDRELHTHILLEDMRLKLDKTGTVARLADVRIDLLRRALPRGEIKAKRVELSGLQVNLRRDTQGRFNLSLGEQATLTDGDALGPFLSKINTLFDFDQTRTIDAIVADGITLRYTDALSEQVLIADGGRISAEQDRSGVRLRADVAVLSGGADVTSLSMSYEAPRDSDKSVQGGAVGITLDGAPAALLASQTPALAWLGVLDAPISGSVRFGLDAQENLGTVFGTLDIGAGALSPEIGARPVAFDSARTYFNYDPTQGRLTFDEVAVHGDNVSAVASGSAWLSDFENGFPNSGMGQFRFTELSAQPDGVFKNLPAFSDAAIDFRVQLDPFTVDIGSAYMVPKVAQGEAPTLRTKGRVRAAEDGWFVALDNSVSALQAPIIMGLWPENVKPITRNWFAENLLGGDIRALELALRLAPNQDPVIQGGFEFSDATLRFLPKMPPIENGAGFGVLEGGRFALALERGHVSAPQGGRIKVDGSDLVIPDLFTKAPPAKIKLVTDSTITAALSVLDQEPLNLMAKAERPVDLADGRASLSVDLALPFAKVIKTEDVVYSARGTLRNVTSNALMEGRQISAQALDIKVDAAGLTLDGAVQAGRVPMDITWAQDFGSDAPSRLTANAELSERFLDEFKIALPNGALSGRGQARLVAQIDKAGGGDFTLTSNLSGVSLALQDLNWRKRANQRGSLEIKGTLGNPATVERIALKAAGLDAIGTIKLNASGGLESAQFSRLKLADWLNAPVTLVGRGAGRTPEIQLRGGFLDMRKTQLGQGGGSAQGGPISLNLDRLIVTDGLELTRVRGALSTQGAFNGKFTALLNGSAPITGTLVPGPKGTAIRVQSDDAGGTVRAAKLLRQARGGGLDLQLQPTGADGTYDGVLKVTNTRVVDAPALASLLNAISVIGLIDQMGSGGILFTQVDASFRLSPRGVTLYSSSATGPSIGLSMDGTYRLSDGAMDMQGVVSPLYALNGIGQIFTRRGEGLIGFNFNLKGTSSAPKVAVNPLSVFTPGMFREIFRRQPPQRN